MMNKMAARGLFYVRKVADLWRFKGRKVENVYEEYCLFFFKAGLW